MCLLILDWPVKLHSRWWCHVQSWVFWSLCCINKVASFSFTLNMARYSVRTQQTAKVHNNWSALMCNRLLYHCSLALWGRWSEYSWKSHRRSQCVCYGSSNWCHISRKVVRTMKCCGSSLLYSPTGTGL